MITITGTNSGQPWTWQSWYAANPAGISEVVPGAVYGIHDQVTFGDGVTATVFQSCNEMVWFDDGMTFNLTEQATLALGELAGDWGINGSFWSLGPAASWLLMAYLDTSVFNVYASRLHIRTNNRTQFYGGQITILNSVLSSIFHEGGINDRAGFYFYSPCESLVLRKVRIENALVLSLSLTPDSFEQIHCHRCYNGVAANSADVTVQGVELTSCDVELIQTGLAACLEVDNPQTPIQTVAIGSNDPAARVVELFDCLIEARDESGAAVASALVTLRQSHVVAYDSTVYRCRVSHTSDTFYADLAAGYWVVDSEIENAPPWRAAMAYVADQYDGGIFNGASGLLTNGEGLALWNDQTPRIPARRWTTTSEWQERWVYTLTIAKAGYESLAISSIDFDRPRRWRIPLSCYRPRALPCGPSVGSAVSGAFV